MTQRDIAKDKEMCNAATPGPWIGVQNDIIDGDRGTVGTINKERNAYFIRMAREALPYWISQYEALLVEIARKDTIHDEVVKSRDYWRDEHSVLEHENDRLQARISELEALLHPNNRPDVVTRTSHDKALETVFREIKEGMA